MSAFEAAVGLMFHIRSLVAEERRYGLDVGNLIRRYPAEAAAGPRHTGWVRQFRAECRI